MRKNCGFTLAELLVASSISILVVISVVALFAMTNRTWREASANVVLQSNGRLILNQLASGSHGRFGLREANFNTIEIENGGNSILFYVDKLSNPTYIETDDTGCRYYLDNNRIWYDPDTSIEGDEYPLVLNGKVENIVFTKNSNYLDIELTMKDYASIRSDAYVKLRTSVFLRKARKVLQ